MQIGHRKEFLKLAFRALALHFDEGLTLETSPLETLCNYNQDYYESFKWWNVHKWFLFYSCYSRSY